jgi:hypothetical protein
MALAKTVLEKSETLITIARNITNAANVHDINGCIGRIVNNKSAISYYIETNNEIKLNYSISRLQENMKTLCDLIIDNCKNLI